MSGIKYQVDMQGWVPYHWIVKLLLSLNSLLISGQYGSLGIMNSFVEIGQMLEYALFYDQFHFHVDQCLHCLLLNRPSGCSQFQQWHNLQYWGRQLAPGYWPYTFASSWILVLLMRAWWYSFDLSFALPRRVLAISTMEYVKLYSYSTDALQIPAWQYLNDR